LLCLFAWGTAKAAEASAYDVTAATSMPHLEENLRYATTREHLCLHPEELSSIFPILHHQSLAGCRLGNEMRRGDTVRYLLLCASPQVATGVARLDTGAGRVTGVLEIKMGGKNMTFTQHVEAVRRGECQPTP
jgi:hypothetical protein